MTPEEEARKLIEPNRFVAVETIDDETPEYVLSEGYVIDLLTTQLERVKELEKAVITTLNEKEFNRILMARIEELKEQLTKMEEPCVWTKSNQWEDDRCFNTACGETWFFEDDGILENGAKFCFHCGHPIKD